MKALIKFSIIAVSLFSASISYAQQEMPYIEEFSCTEGKFGLKLPSRLPDVLKIEKIIKEEIYDVEKWDGFTATSKTISFSGLKLMIVTFSNDKNRYMISGAEISDEKWAKISYFSVGESTESVQKKIGKLARKDIALKLTYGNEGGELKFKTKDNKVIKISYSCYTG